MQSQSVKYSIEIDKLKGIVKQIRGSFLIPQEIKVIIQRQAETLEYANLICDHLQAKYALDEYIRKTGSWNNGIIAFKKTVENMQEYTEDVYETHTRLAKYERLHLDTNSNNTVGYEPI